ncbi:MAG: isoaspartyl peptidase/L-asparaginase, partial [Pirellula sp.]
MFRSTVRKKKSALVNILAAGLVGTIFVVQGSAQDTKTPMENKVGTWSLAIHGGAGGDPNKLTPDITKAKMDGLRTALAKGQVLLSKGALAIDVVQTVVEVLEDDPNFNAGRGAVFNDVGDISLDASLMDGTDLS